MGTQPDGVREIGFVTVLRALACLMVVYCHLVDGATRLKYRIHWAPAGAIDGYILTPLGIIQGFGFLGVALFFLISGFIVTHAAQRDSVHGFFVKRVLRIYPPLIVVILLAWPLMPTPVSWRDALLSMTLGNVFSTSTPVLGVAWTLSIEMMFYLHLTVCVPLLRRNTPAVATTLAAWSVVATEAVARSGHAARLNSVGVMVEYMPVFACGMLAWAWWRGRIAGRWAVSLGGVAYLCAAHNLWRIQPSLVPEPNAYIAQIAYAAAIFVACLLVADRIAVARPVAWVARISYSLYLVHFPVGFWLLDKLVPRLGYTLALAVTVACLGLLSHAIWRCVERPSQRAARALLGLPARPIIALARDLPPASTPAVPGRSLSAR